MRTASSDDMTGGKHGMAVNTAELQWYMEDISFPATKERIVNLARGNHAPDGVLDLLKQLPDREYSSPDDVIRAAGITE
ncbi:MAG: hypothetical protein BWZ01_00809 [Deltaproteobacteria bacterium ADurb.BinA179]|jgi:hypothetical protein|nr:MAG: hypothetical protein BWZ01_00809 [Deltaproteobacteria bacterium ADurb.BinA179]